MRFRFSGLTALVAVVSGCGLTGPTPSEEPPQSGHITIDGTTLNTRSVECTQHEWSMMIDAKAEPGSAQVFLELGGTEPIVRTVTIENVNDINGAFGGDASKADATARGSVYTVSGTVVGSDRRHPGKSRTMPFEIKAPC